MSLTYSGYLFYILTQQSTSLCVLYFGYFPEITAYHFPGILTPHSTFFLEFYFGHFPDIELTIQLLFSHCSWCSCSVCDEWGKLNGVAFKIILATHDDPCVCICGFCDQDCKAITRLSPSYLMSHMLCPGALQFAQSSVILYKWDCIFNRYISNDFYVCLILFLT